ncbi:MAG TPA: metallophosphoesterase [Polyangiaceae bacterium]
MLRALAYFVGAVVVTAIVHAYLHRRLVRDAGFSSRVARVITWALAALLPAGMIGLLMMRDAPRALQAPVMWCAFVWIGALGFLLPIVLASEAVRPLPKSPERRRALARIVGLAGGAATLALGGASIAIAEMPLVVRRVRVRLPGLGASLRGYTIAQISDVHVSATIGRARVEAIVAAVRALAPDLVAVTGDLVDGSVPELGPLLAPLGELRAKDGVFFVTGNHEYLSGAEEWLAFLPSLGLRALRNERVAIGGEDGFDLIGVDDPSGSSWLPGHGTDLEAATRGRDRARASVLLAHRPDDVHDAAARGIGLQISGHTHGGQIEPVGWALERMHQPYVCGLYEVGETVLYVTSGAGYWGPPMRLGTRAEIVLFELS